MTNTPDARPALPSPTAELSCGGEMPLLGFGTWQLSGRHAREGVGWALDAGYRHIDTATAYGNQKEVGAAIAASGVPRAELFVTTKLPPDHAGRERRTLDESLAQLGLEYLDLWLVHWPPNGSASPEVWRELVRARDEGLVRDIGVSNYSPAQLDELTAATEVTPAVNQIPWSPLRYDRELLAAHRERDVVLEGYSPFRGGSLDAGVLHRIASAHGKSASQIIVRWHLQHGIVVIPKSSHRDRIQANADVFDLELSADEMAAIDALGGS